MSGVYRAQKGPRRHRTNHGNAADFTLYDAAHGFGRVPDGVNVWLECTTADKGYAVGDCLIFPDSYDASYSYGGHRFMNATHYGITVAGEPYLRNKDGATNGYIDWASWDLICEAWVWE